MGVEQNEKKPGESVLDGDVFVVHEAASDRAAFVFVRRPDMAQPFEGRDREVLADVRQEDHPERIEDLLPAGSVILADWGHWTQQRRPEAVNRELLGFLDGL
ncbi:hypothetical protein [Streptomyces mirabilis]|uniref:hypothetical protein n=1 Tax=Streptomyces mirabilis TaxID=68239 RepID=UPI0036D82A39